MSLEDIDFEDFLKFLKDNVGVGIDKWDGSEVGDDYIFRGTFVEYNQIFEDDKTLRDALDVLQHMDLLGNGGIIHDFGGRKKYDRIHILLK